MNSVFLSAAMTVGASYTNVCLTREQVQFVETDDPTQLGRISPTEEQLTTRSGYELCKDEGGRYPWLFGIDGITLTDNEWASLLVGKLKTEFVGRLAAEAGKEKRTCSSSLAHTIASQQPLLCNSTLSIFAFLFVILTTVGDHMHCSLPAISVGCLRSSYAPVCTGEEVGQTCVALV